MATIRIYTIYDHIQHRHAILGWCAEHGLRPIDLPKLVEIGYGDRDVVTDFPKVCCEICRVRFSSFIRSPPSEPESKSAQTQQISD